MPADCLPDDALPDDAVPADALPAGALPADPLDATVLDTARDAALAAFAASGYLPALAAARTASTGDRSPLALARRAIGGLPGPAKADAGKRVNVLQAAITTAYDARRIVL